MFHSFARADPVLELFVKIAPSFKPLTLLVKKQHSLHKKMKFPIKDFFSRCDQIRRKLRIWSHLLKKPLMENFIFCAVIIDVRWDPKYVPGHFSHCVIRSISGEVVAQ